MKINSIRAGALLAAVGGLILAAGCVVQPDGRVSLAPVVIQPAVVGPPPPPVVVAPAPAVYVPDSYFWDGTEYVGLVGDQYCYLGPGNVWIVAEPWRLDRIHVWIGGHPDWRAHLVVNERFRTDRYGHVAPRREERRDDHRDDHHDDHH